jgi:hypothetical protein
LPALLLLAACSAGLLNCSAALYEESLRAAARLLMMHDRLLGRLTCNLLLYTLLDGGLRDWKQRQPASSQQVQRTSTRTVLPYYM